MGVHKDIKGAGAAVSRGARCACLAVCMRAGRGDDCEHALAELLAGGACRAESELARGGRRRQAGPRGQREGESA